MFSITKIITAFVQNLSQQTEHHRKHAENQPENTLFLGKRIRRTHKFVQKNKYDKDNEATQPKPKPEQHVRKIRTSTISDFSSWIQCSVALVWMCSSIFLRTTPTGKGLKKLSCPKKYCNVYGEQHASNMSFNCTKTTFGVKESCSELYLMIKSPSWFLTCVALSLMKEIPFPGIYFWQQDGKCHKVCSTCVVLLKHFFQNKKQNHEMHNLVSKDLTFFQFLTHILTQVEWFLSNFL